MPAEEWREIQDQFERALELPPAERAGVLEALAAANPAVAAEVRSLLAAHDQQHRLIDAPRQEHLPKGMRVGPYAIDSLIGTGGMSAVYLGHRVDGQFDKKVAIKLITGLAESIDDARSRSERQILAGLEHPNIARLIDSGVNEFGQSYLSRNFPAPPNCRRRWSNSRSAISTGFGAKPPATRICNSR